MPADHAVSPLNPLPGPVWLLILAVAGVELTILAGAAGYVGGPSAIGWRLELTQRLAFSGALFEWMIENRRYPPEHLLRLLAYPFIHSGPLHALFVVVFIAALGKFVAEGMRGRALAVIVLFLGSAAMGAAAWGWALAAPYWLTGGYPGVFGLVGAFTFLIWVDLGRKGANPAPAFILIGVLLGLRLGISLFAGGSGAWIADLAGFAAGFGLSPLLMPGGPARLRARLRHH